MNISAHTTAHAEPVKTAEIVLDRTQEVCTDYCFSSRNSRTIFTTACTFSTGVVGTIP